MFQQPLDFKEESNSLHRLLAEKSDEELAMETQFKGWTINNVIGHLHMWNHAADLSLMDEPGFQIFMRRVGSEASSLREFEDIWLEGLKGRNLLEAWRTFYLAMADHFSGADPKRRLKWAGPDMSARSSITARLMETWAHGQEIFDSLGVVRRDEDRIRNVCVIGVNTFGWTFSNRGLDLPGDLPCLRLTAPSGEIWEWGDMEADSSITGDATEFCQVVTQTRNIADTSLKVEGDVATRWMEIAQCFAGGPQDPPPVGLRHLASVTE